MKVLVTAGATRVPIDKVRAITNIFKGKTGTAIACYFSEMGAEVTLVTSNPAIAPPLPNLSVLPYKTYRDLYAVMWTEILNGTYDAVIHSAAVSDYEVSAVLCKDEAGCLAPIDAGKKVSSSHNQLYLELTPTQKIINLIRSPAWNFRGKLVKFKLEVGKSIAELVEIATKSVNVSEADLIVANCLEWSQSSALIVNPDGSFVDVERSQLSKELYRRLQ